MEATLDCFTTLLPQSVMVMFQRKLLRLRKYQERIESYVRKRNISVVCCKNERGSPLAHKSVRAWIRKCFSCNWKRSLKIYYVCKNIFYVFVYIKIIYFFCASRVLLMSTTLLHLTFACSHWHSLYNAWGVSLASIRNRSLSEYIKVKFCCSVIMNFYLS